jgi:hypothetical protein
MCWCRTCFIREQSSVGGPLSLQDHLVAILEYLPDLPPAGEPRHADEAPSASGEAIPPFSDSEEKANEIRDHNASTTARSTEACQTVSRHDDKRIVRLFDDRVDSIGTLLANKLILTQEEASLNSRTGVPIECCVLVLASA